MTYYEWVTILYKSGIKVQCQVKNLEIEWATNDSHVTKLTWDDSAPWLMAGLHNIEAIYRGKV